MVLKSVKARASYAMNVIITAAFLKVILPIYHRRIALKT